MQIRSCEDDSRVTKLRDGRCALQCIPAASQEGLRSRIHPRGAMTTDRMPTTMKIGVIACCSRCINSGCDDSLPAMSVPSSRPCKGASPMSIFSTTGWPRWYAWHVWLPPTAEALSSSQASTDVRRLALSLPRRWRWSRPYPPRSGAIGGNVQSRALRLLTESLAEATCRSLHSKTTVYR